MFLKIHHNQVGLIREIQEDIYKFIIARRRRTMIVLVYEKKSMTQSLSMVGLEVPAMTADWSPSNDKSLPGHMVAKLRVPATFATRCGRVWRLWSKGCVLIHLAGLSQSKNSYSIF